MPVEFAKHEIYHAEGFNVTKVEEDHSNAWNSQRIPLEAGEQRCKFSDQPSRAGQTQTPVNQTIESDEKARKHGKLSGQCQEIVKRHFYSGKKLGLLEEGWLSEMPGIPPAWDGTREFDRRPAKGSVG
jgi:hypothetical protein